MNSPTPADNTARNETSVVDAVVIEEKAAPADTPAQDAQPGIMAKLKPVLDMAHKAFTEHPASAGETYWQHLMFTLGMGSRLVFAGAVIIIHGILPFTLTYTGSNQLKKCNKILSERAAAAQMPQESPLPYGDHI